MRIELKEWKELSDSRELLEAKTYPYGTFFLYALITFIIIALSWSYWGSKDKIVKAHGVVRPLENISTVTNKVLGRVDEVYFQQGMEVKQGDLLYVVAHDEQLLHQEALEGELKKVHEDLELLNKLRDCILKDENDFNINQKHHQEYYEMYLKYVNQKRQLEQESGQNMKGSTSTTITFEIECKEIKQRIYDISLLIKSIEQGDNLFRDHNNLYVKKFNEYELASQRLTKKVDSLKKTYEISRVLGEDVIPRQKIEEDEAFYQLAQLELSQYKNDYMVQLLNEKDQLHERLRQVDRNIANTNNAIEQLKIDTLVQVNDWLQRNEQNKEKLGEQLKALQININDSYVRAPINGIVNIVKQMNRGDLLQTGMEVLTIIPTNGKKIKVQLMVHNREINQIKIGDSVSYRFSSSSFRQAGELRGEINSIGSDAISNPNDGIRYYVVEASIDISPLKNFDDDRVDVKIGMETEGSIITGSQKIVHYVLQKINLRD